MTKVEFCPTNHSTPFHSVEVEFVEQDLTLLDSSGSSRTLPLRLVREITVNGGVSPFEYAFERLRLSSAALGDDEKNPHRAALLLLRLGALMKSEDTHVYRRFELTSLRKYDAFRDIRPAYPDEPIASSQLLNRIAVPPDIPTEKLVEEALFGCPKDKLPFSQVHYEVFRSEVLSEFFRFAMDLNSARRNETPDGLRSTSPPSEAGPRASKSAHSMHPQENDSIPVADAVDVASGLIAYDRLIAESFAPIVPQARDHYEFVFRSLVNRGIDATVEKPLENYPPEYVAGVADALDQHLVEEMAEQILQVLEAVATLIRSSGDRFSDLSLKKLSQSRAYVELARQSSDSMDKWCLLVWVLTQLVNKDACWRLLLREADEVFHSLLDWSYRQIYKALKPLLSASERRAFRLMCFQQSFTGNRVIAAEPALLSFYTRQTEEIKSLTLLRLVHRIETGDSEDSRARLCNLWRSYLKLYPTWLIIRQTSQAEAKRRVTIYNRESRGGDDLSLRFSEDDSTDTGLPITMGMIEHWIELYCTPEQSAFLRRHYLACKTQAEIARDVGVSQTWISRMLHDARKQVQEGLANRPIKYSFSNGRIDIRMHRSSGGL